MDAAWRIERLGALGVALAATGDPASSVRRAGVGVTAEAAADPDALRGVSPIEVPGCAARAATAMLREPDPSARKVGATALGVLAALGAPGALGATLGALDETDASVRIAIGRAAVLAGAGESALAPVVSALGDPRAAVSQTGAQVMVFVAQHEGAAAARWALAPLVAAVRSRDLVLQRLAAVALGWLREAAADARPFLVQGTNAGDPDLRAACLGALARVDAALGSPPLELLLAALDSRDCAFRNAAYAALFELGAAAAPLLRTAAHTPSPAGSTPDPAARGSSPRPPAWRHGSRRWRADLGIETTWTAECWRKCWSTGSASGRRHIRRRAKRPPEPPSGGRSV